LFKFGAPEAGRHWGIGGLTIVLIVLFSQYLARRNVVFRLFPVLLGIGGAWLVAAFLTMTGTFGPGHPAYCSLEGVAQADWIQFPLPFQHGGPVFVPAMIVAMLAGYIASMVESVGDYYACARLSGAKTPDEVTINRGIGMEGIGCLIAGIFGTGNGTTSYSENIGAIGLTRVGSRRVVQAGACVMIVLAMFGKFGALFTAIPQPIVGGMYCAMFGMIAAVGLSNLQFIDLNSGRNLFILGFALFMGLSVPEYFAQHPLTWPGALGPVGDILTSIGKTGMAVGALCAFVMDNTVPGTDEERGLTAWKR
jgi:nucleobase transporter 1/2